MNERIPIPASRHGLTPRRGARLPVARLLVARLLVTSFALVFLFLSAPSAPAEITTQHTSVDRSGEIPAGNALILNLSADLGSVRIETLPPNAPAVVRYTAHIETDARQPFADSLLEKYVLSARVSPTNVSISASLPSLRMKAGKNVQFWVQFVVYVPGNFSVEVSTGGGDIETSDIGGHAVLITQGGNIRTGRIGSLRGNLVPADHPVAKFETQGGHINMLDVGGDVDAYTAGGHIQAGNIIGNARLRTGGGHIRAGQIKGAARLETEGGNITVGEAGSVVGVRTGGGQIDFGEVHGSVRAQTAGGGIRVMYVSGPMEVESSGGSICLTRVVNTVRAETDAGTITAWITPDSRGNSNPVRLPGPSQLASATGDINVYLPRNMAATIDATVENGASSRIEADPGLALSYQSHPEGAIHAMGMLNGGGAVLKLRTSAGKIRLQYIDNEVSLRQSLQEEEKQRLAQKLSEAGLPQPAMHMNAMPVQPGPGTVAGPSEEKEEWSDSLRKRMQAFLWGSVSENPEEFKKRLVTAPAPDYPQVAKLAGVTGMVLVQLRVKTDGSISVERVIEGQPALVDATVAAIRQWRGNPEQINGKKVEVVSTMSFNFQLH
jgi:TonB family protein